MPKKNKELSFEEQEEVVNGYRHGASMRDLGKEYGVTTPVIKSILFSSGVKITRSNLRSEREAAVEMYKCGASPNYIKFTLGVSKEMSARLVKDEPKNRPDSSSKTMWADYKNICCFDCHVIRPKEMHFIKNRYNARCPKCFYMFVRINIKPSELRARAERDDIPYDGSISPDYLRELMERQKFKCFYTDKPFEFTHEYNRLGPSIDKMNPEKGYVKDNIVWCTRHANVVKNDLSLRELYEYHMPEWAGRIERELVSRGSSY